jgi:choline dehydrogenase-like flavoprotein
LTIANHLQKYFDVEVIEKSKYRKYPIVYKIPLFIGLLFRNEKTKYISKRDVLLSNDRIIPFYESNVLGGASIINGCVHMLGSKFEWGSILKKFNSDYDELLDSYEKLYSTNKDKNKINLIPASQNIIDNLFLKTLNQKNIPIGNMDFSDKEACGPILNTTKKYFRSSVLSLIHNKVFKLFTGEIVENILFNKYGKVTGVKTKRRIINSDYIILSGGVIGTCDMLLRIKHEDHVQNSKILDNILIGNDIQDHTNLRINVLTKINIGSLNEISNNFFKKLFLVFKHFSGRPSLMTGTGATSAAHLDLNNDGLIDTRIQIVQFSETGRHGSDGTFFGSKPGFSISITSINPESKGEIKMNGENNIVNPKFLSEENDIELLKLALKYCIKLLRSKPLSEYILKIENEYAMENDAEKYIHNNIFSSHHLIGGTHNAINSNFEVNNIEGLYICDASVFSSYAASNIHSSVVLLADIFSKKFIKNNLLNK